MDLIMLKQIRIKQEEYCKDIDNGISCAARDSVNGAAGNANNNANTALGANLNGVAKNSFHHIGGRFYWCDVLKALPLLLEEYEGKIQLVYMDPPFVTGQLFRFQQPVGAEGWKGNRKYIITHTAYDDVWKAGKDAFLSMMREVLCGVHRLLSPEGSLYLHIDYRTSAYLRIMLDEIFGEENFLNEVIWHYQSGGRAKKHFSRKHDTILFYRKSPQYYFNIESVGIPRGKDKRNHMKQQVDEYGRIFWSIKSGGKEYRYYEDSKVYPSDVWDDISHLHQKDPERSGYDTQKPEALLERIIKASSRPGDVVADLFAGSGTTLAVAQRLGRSWIGVDNGIFSLHTCRKRLIRTFYGATNSCGKLCSGQKGSSTICFVHESLSGDCKPGLDKVDLNENAGSVLKRCAKLKFCYHVDFQHNIEGCAVPQIRLECVRLSDQIIIRLIKYEVSIDQQGQHINDGVRQPVFNAEGISTKADGHSIDIVKHLSLGPVDLVDFWAVGYIESDVFNAYSCSMRTYDAPCLNDELRLPVRGNDVPAVHIVDVYGQQWFFQIEEGD